MWQPGLVSEPPPSNQHTTWSLLKAKMALLFKHKLFIYQSKQNSLEEFTVFFFRLESRYPRDWSLLTREPGEPWMSVEACFLKHASPRAPQALRISMIGTNVLTGAICWESVVHRLHNLSPWPPGALCQRRVATKSFYLVNNIKQNSSTYFCVMPFSLSSRRLKV